MSIPKVAVLVTAVAIVVALGTVVVSDSVGTPSADSVDVGFLQDMIYHHQQAVQLGAIGAEISTDPTTRHFAQETLIAQQYEVGYMTALLESWGYGLGSTDRDAMKWMNVPVPLGEMPGILSDEQVSAYQRMSGPEANIAFLRLMSEHHRGGIHMARYAAKHAGDKRVRDLAARIVKNQESELAEFERAATELGATL